MSLSTDYRPKTFNELVGQRHVIDILIAQAKSDQLGHCYLLFGPRGTGKTSTARLLAKVMNCTTYDADGNPDLLNDPAAKLIDTQSTIDYVEIDAASYTGVDNIREEIIDKALYQPAHLKKKVYVIDEVHMLSKGAFNALLKIMEEPPEYLIFILATTEIHKVPDTILSRCQVFNFKHLSIEEIAGRLEDIAKKEQITFEPEALRLIAKLSSGALRDGVKYLEQISILGAVTESNVARFLGVVSESLINEAMELLQGTHLDAWTAFLDRLVAQGADLYNFAKELLNRLDIHFIEDPTRYGALAEMIQEITKELKRHPHPVLLRKAKSLQHFQQQTGTCSPAPQSPPVAQSVAPSPAAPAPSVPPTSSPAQTPTAAPSQAAEPQQTAGEPTPSSIRSATPEEIITTLTQHTKNMMVRSALKQYTIIQEINEQHLGAIVINEQFYHTLSKTEIMHDLEKTLHHVYNFSGHIKLTYMTKEDWMARQL